MHQTVDSYPMNVSNEIGKLPSPSLASLTRRGPERSDDCKFLDVLHLLLDENDDATKSNVISWDIAGLSFRIHDTVRFEHYLLPAYFGPSSAYITEDNHKHKPLENYESFLKRLQSYGFYRFSSFSSSTEDFYKDTFSHPLFVRGKKDLALHISCFEPKSFFHRQANNWPMPALSSNKTNKPTFKYEFCRLERKSRPRPCSANVSKVKKRKNDSFQRKISNPSSVHPIDKRQYSLSLKETLLQRKGSTAYGSQEQPKCSILELLDGVSFGDDEDTNASSDDYEPISLKTSEDKNLPARHFPCPVTNPSTIDNDEPLNPDCQHEIDHLLEGDVAETLARI
mmetsp:Transcript_17792/g.44399  ORF Transcript_17792/g.44399 Transcript_17792/m.44399 type:complete len:339 (+) Transcript_17792:104-1120(+)